MNHNDILFLTSEKYKDKYLQAVYVEHKMLRDEISVTTTQIYSILGLGSSIVAAALGFGFNFWGKQDPVVLLILGILSPTLSFVFIEIILGQIVRIKRAGIYCHLIENKIKAIIIGNCKEISPAFEYPIGWENWLRKDRHGKTLHVKWLYFFSVALFIFFSFFSLSMHFYYKTFIMKYQDSSLNRMILLFPIMFELIKFWIAYVQVKDIFIENKINILTP